MNVVGFDLSQLGVPDVTHAMQLALGPVFLLNGVGILLSLLTARLARIVDRARSLEARLPVAEEAQAAELDRVRFDALKFGHRGRTHVRAVGVTEEQHRHFAA